MARPQIENGFTKIAHELLDAICRFKFNGAQLRIIMKIWRLTYGYNRIDHDFSISFLSEETGLSESAVKKELKTLIDSSVLIVTEKATRSTSRRLSFNKNYDDWTIPKSGDSVEQLELFSSDEVHDRIPNKKRDQAHDCTPHQVHDCIPNSDYEGHDCTPIKRNKDLNITIKDKESMFEQFYLIYPRKASKKKAESSWRTLCKEKGFDPDKVILLTMNFVETCKLLKTETKYIPYPATFLNQKRYEEYEVIDPEGLAAKKKSKLESNIDFLKSQIGGGINDERSGRVAIDESIGRLPKPSS